MNLLHSVRYKRAPTAVVAAANHYFTPERLTLLPLTIHPQPPPPQPLPSILIVLLYTTVLCKSVVQWKE